jgi:peptidoglycan/LPS O-acetylase OafA/YrhL
MIKKEEGRFYQLDFSKAIAIVVVILIHVLANRLNQPFFSFLWN